MNETETRTYAVPFAELPDLAAAAVGGEALAANDEFFAGKENLLKPGRGVFIAGKFTEQGKWMDGWETRRKRNAPAGDYDWCLVKLGIPGRIHGVCVDTNHFVGNYPEFAAVDAAEVTGSTSPSALAGSAMAWEEIVPRQRLRGGSENWLPVANERRWTHVRLRIYPDGGVARLRVHGDARPDWKKLGAAGPVDLAALENGGTVLGCNDNFFGPKDNLILPGRAATMGDGWETRRKRGPGHDWIVVRLGRPGTLTKVEIDTNHFKGNYPDRASLEACALDGNPVFEDLVRDPKIAWREVLPAQKLGPHARHTFEKELKAGSAVSHVRLNIFPDGGISRLRIWGNLA